METYIRQFAGVEPDHPDLVRVHLLAYDMSLDPPDAADAAAWSEHFRLDGVHAIALAPDPPIAGDATFAMIPGFHLIDRDFRLASSSPKSGGDDLYRELLPRLGELLGER